MEFYKDENDLRVYLNLFIEKNNFSDDYDEYCEKFSLVDTFKPFKKNIVSSTSNKRAKAINSIIEDFASAREICYDQDSFVCKDNPLSISFDEKLVIVHYDSKFIDLLIKNNSLSPLLMHECGHIQLGHDIYDCFAYYNHIRRGLRESKSIKKLISSKKEYAIFEILSCQFSKIMELNADRFAMYKTKSQIDFFKSISILFYKKVLSMEVFLNTINSIEKIPNEDFIDDFYPRDDLRVLAMVDFYKGNVNRTNKTIKFVNLDSNKYTLSSYIKANFMN